MAPMNDSEKIQSFGDMVDATEKMAAPWRRTNLILTIAMVVTNLFWAIALCLFIWFAYMAPDTTYQYQDFNDQHQGQSTGTEVVTPQGD